MNHLQGPMSGTRIAVIERPNGTIIKRAFTHSDVETAQQLAVRWLERTLHPRTERFTICFPEFDFGLSRRWTTSGWI